MKYICTICGYIYDDEKEKIPFESLPDDWKCPICKAPKSSFKKESFEVETTKERSQLEFDKEDLTKLSNGQLAAIFSNIARGYEKQYKSDYSTLADQLADYFVSRAEDSNLTSLDDLGLLLKEDIDNNYPVTKDIAKENLDRGTQRICVWGEKVTRMLSSLVDRYKEEGESFLGNTNVWVCTVCGFVYIGDNAPELCPVCKVPSWKFEKIEGRK